MSTQSRWLVVVSLLALFSLGGGLAIFISGASEYPRSPRGGPRGEPKASEASDVTVNTRDPDSDPIAPLTPAVAQISGAPEPPPTKTNYAFFSQAPDRVSVRRLPPGVAESDAQRLRREARAGQAASLNHRLEARVAELRTRVEQARGEERVRLTNDLQTLESNLSARRRLEDPSVGPNRMVRGPETPRP